MLLVEKGPGLSGAISIPLSVDRWLGDSGEPEAVKESGGLYPDPRAAAYVGSVGQRLVRVSRRPKYGFRFGVVAEKGINAFALPNGGVYATAGLLRALRSEAQLANVLGHEIAHVTERHGIEQMGVNLGTLGLLEMAGAVMARRAGAEETGKAKELVFGLISNGYSRKDESESDEVGQELAARAGYSPRGMVEVMKIFHSLEKEEPKGLEAYFRSHPYAGDRVKSAERRLPDLGEGEEAREGYEKFLTTVMAVSQDDARSRPKAAQVFRKDLPTGLLWAGGAVAAILLLVILFR